MKSNAISRRNFFAISAAAVAYMGLNASAPNKAFGDSPRQSSVKPLNFELQVKDISTGQTVIDSSKSANLLKRQEPNTQTDVGWEVLDSSAYDNGDRGIANLALKLAIPVTEANQSESSTGIKTRGDCTAELTISYDIQYLSGGERMVRITNLSGRWTPALNSILIQSREVHAHQGWFIGGITGGQSGHWYPEANTFDIDTGWTKWFDAISTDEWFNEGTSYCQVYVPSMGNGYEVNVRVSVE